MNAPSPPDERALTAAREHFFAGIEHFEAGRLQPARERFEAALALAPGRPSVLLNLAAVLVRQNEPAAALARLDAALAAAPDDAPAWYSRGQTLQMLERPAEALASYERTIALDPKAGPAHSQRGQILKDMRRFAEAAAAFRRALELGHEPELNRYFLASVDGAKGEAAPQAAPREYVENLFDSYAEQFDAHLTGKLGYRTPQVLAELLQRAAPRRRFGAALDLGCGTGLMAPLLVPLIDDTGTLDGIDLSSRMLEKAATLKRYRTLVHGDIVEHLNATPLRYDLVIAADVFVYVGALDAVFAGVRRVLEPGGLFVFSVEEATGSAGLELRPSSRYAHAEAYLRERAAAVGLECRHLERTPLRRDQAEVIGGLVAVMAAP